MNNKEFMRKVYRKFSDFIAVAAAHELDLLVFDAKYTTDFSYRLKHILNEIRESGRTVAELSVLFNTNGDVAVIDSEIVGRYISDRYTVEMEEYYKDASLNKIVKSVVNGSRKVKQDFLSISYEIIYTCIDELYMEIKCRKDMLEQYKEEFKLTSYNEEDSSAVIAALLMLDDIAKYIGIRDENITELISSCIYKKYSQE
jgi:hypothetical protein